MTLEHTASDNGASNRSFKGLQGFSFFFLKKNRVRWRTPTATTKSPPNSFKSVWSSVYTQKMTHCFHGPTCHEMHPFGGRRFKRIRHHLQQWPIQLHEQLTAEVARPPKLHGGNSARNGMQVWHTYQHHHTGWTPGCGGHPSMCPHYANVNIEALRELGGTFTYVHESSFSISDSKDQLSNRNFVLGIRKWVESVKRQDVHVSALQVWY